MSFQNSVKLILVYMTTDNDGEIVIPLQSMKSLSNPDSHHGY